MREEKKYGLDEFLSLVRPWHTKRNVTMFDGDPIKLGSERYKLFKTKGVACVSCGIRGEFFAKTCSGNGSFHMNLYAVRPDGREVLMTKDHIQPRSRGGQGPPEQLPDHVRTVQL